jgi:YVTN family beta-propeller protein
VAATVAVLPLTGDNQAAVIDLASHAIKFKVDTGIAPFGAVVNSSGTVAYVSNWGGRKPQAGDMTAATGYRLDRDQVVVDSHGIASTGSLTRIDLKTGQVTDTIAAGLHPTAMAWDESRERLYVANGNEDSIAIIDTKANRALKSIPLQPFREKAPGIAPTALAISSDGTTLYVACGGINAVAAVKLATGAVAGLIPTAWYPNGLSLSSDGRFLAISTLMGAGAGYRDDPRKRAVQAIRGSIAVVRGSARRRATRRLHYRGCREQSPADRPAGRGGRACRQPCAAGACTGTPQ